MKSIERRRPTLPARRSPPFPPCQHFEYLHSQLCRNVPASLQIMGKRKRKAHNVVKVDLGDFTVKKSDALPVLVQHLSKDHRRIEQTVHQIPISRSNPPPPTFDPCPVVAEDGSGDDIFFDVEPLGEEDREQGGDRVCLHFSSLFCVSDSHGGRSWIRYGRGARIAMFISRDLSCGKGVWSSPRECVTIVRIRVHFLPSSMRSISN